MPIVCIWSSLCHCIPQTPSSLGFTFLVPADQAVLEKRPLNGCSSGDMSCILSQLFVAPQVVETVLERGKRVCVDNDDNNNSHDNVYGAVIMTRVIARVHPVHLMNVD